MGANLLAEDGVQLPLRVHERTTPSGSLMMFFWTEWANHATQPASPATEDEWSCTASMTESAADGLRLPANESPESSTEVVRVLEAQGRSNLADGQSICPQQFLRFLDLQALMMNEGRLPVLPLEHAGEGRRGYLQVLAKGTGQIVLREVLRHPTKRQLHSHGWFGGLDPVSDEPRHGNVDPEMQLLDGKVRQLVRSLDFLPTLRMGIFQLALETRADLPLTVFPGANDQVPAPWSGAPDPNQKVRDAIWSVQPTARAVRINHQKITRIQRFPMVFEYQDRSASLHQHVMPSRVAGDGDRMLPIETVPPRQIDQIQLRAFRANPPRTPRRRQM
jgi:hypothetical protein